MAATLACARAGVTTGEWAGALREVFGEYRAPTGVSARSASGRGGGATLAGGARAGARDRRGARRRGCGCSSASRASTGTPTAPSRSRCARATPASRWSTRASGSRRRRSSRPRWRRTCTCVGLSILSGSHLALVPDVLDGLRAAGRGRRAGRRRRDHPGRRRRGRCATGRGRGLHAEGLRAHRHHGRVRPADPRGARSRPPSAFRTSVVGSFAGRGRLKLATTEVWKREARQETPVADSRRESAAAPSVPSSRR